MGKNQKTAFSKGGRKQQNANFGTFYQKTFENFGIFLFFSFVNWDFIAIFAPNKIEKDGRKNI